MYGLHLYIGLKQEGESCGSCFCPPTYTAGNCAPGLQCQKDPRISDASGKCVQAGKIANQGFQNTRFQITYNNQYTIWICPYNSFSFLKEMVIIRTLDQSILAKRQMNKGWKITYVLRVVNAMIHRIWISHRPIVGRKYSSILFISLLIV